MAKSRRYPSNLAVDSLNKGQHLSRRPGIKSDLIQYTSIMGSIRPIIFVCLISICFTIILASDLNEKKDVLPKKINLENINEKKQQIVEKTENNEPGSKKLLRSKLKMITAAQVEEINKSNKKWKAKVHSKFADKTPAELNKFLGVKPTIDEEQKLKRNEQLKLLKRNKRSVENNKLLEEYKEFDARTEWPECKDVIDTIQDQSACGSCWAVSSASVMQDRICISTGGELKVNISSEDILSCEKTSYGCYGGYPEEAFKFWQEKGVCTGSGYSDHEGCKPYPFPPNPDEYMYSTPRCKRRCENRKYKTKYNKDKHYGQEPVSLQDSDETDIMKAIIEGGPVEANFIVYYDFFSYSEGVYEAGDGEEMAGGHAIRIIGWGHHNKTDTPYWLVNWGTNYGDPALDNNTLASEGAMRASKRREEKRQKLANIESMRKN
uniref:Peptidase C1A papain C-terminal domain-containing protein n=1 Tax=Meloidogyne floridensis TaxID=298350 RepID=A0A915NSF7_9BILA